MEYTLLNSTSEVDEFLADSKKALRIGDTIGIIVSENIVEQVPSIAMKYGFAIIDGEDTEDGMIKLLLEYRHLR
ncbi:MAG: hypothetical protein OWQ54_03945 [Sulfolobaceae archaeon]|nr:hypothetical protein [Sulfolobaceae archaeon]